MSQGFSLDPDIDGPGIFVGFILTGAITLSVSLVLSRLEVHIQRLPDTQIPPRSGIEWLAQRLAPRNQHLDTSLKFWKEVLEKLVLSLSDQQLLTGLLLLPIALAKYWGDSDLGNVYVAADLAFFSSITHAATLLALQSYFSKYFWMTLIRLILTGTTFILWAFVVLYEAHYELVPRLAAEPFSTYAQVVVTGVFQILELVGLLWMYGRIGLSLYGSKPAQSIRGEGIVLPLLIFLFILGLAVLAWDMQESGLQSSWGFGQLLPTFLVLLPFYQLAETYVEERQRRTAHPSQHI